MKPAEQIVDALKKALADLGIEGVQPVLERPDISRGDWSTPVALKACGPLVHGNFSNGFEKNASWTVGRPEPVKFDNPQELSKALVTELSKVVIPGVEKIETAGPGFINFHLTNEYFLETLRSIDADYGKGDELSGTTVLVEYTQPNILKPFHIGHLMSNAIGESIAKLIENSGARVTRANYQGDVGLHVAKALWAMKKESVSPQDIGAVGLAYVHGNQMYETDDVAKQEIVEINKQVYAKDPVIWPLYEEAREASLESFEKLYKVLGTEFDEYFFESETWEKGKDLVEKGLGLGIFEKSDGAVVFPGEKYGLHTRVFLTKDNLPTYEAKDLGLTLLKTERCYFDESITITAIEQAGYFDVVFEAGRMLFNAISSRVVKSKFSHQHHGMMRFASGKMSSRLGNVVTGASLLEDVIGEAFHKVGDRVDSNAKDVAECVGVAAIKYSILRQATEKNIVFDKEKSLSFEGDSGPYIQYTAVRSRSVVGKALDAGIKPSFTVHPESVGLVERMLERFPEVAKRAAEEREPHHVATYLIELSSAFNSWYAQEQIIDVDDALSPYRVALADAVSNVLARGLWLLGIRVPAAM